MLMSRNKTREWADFDPVVERKASFLRTGALQSALLTSANFSSIATDVNGMIQIFNFGAERMLGYSAADVMDKFTPADISDPNDVSARARNLSVEFATQIAPAFEALVFKASRGMDDIFELTYRRKDGGRFPAVVSVTALTGPGNDILGYLLIGTDNSARRRVECERERLLQRLRDRNLLSSASGRQVSTSTVGRVADRSTA